MLAHHLTLLAAIMLAAIMLLALPGVASQAFPLSPDDPAITSALEYIASHQTADGGFGQLGESDLSTTSRVIEALIAADRDPEEYEVTGNGIEDYLSSVAESVYAGAYGSNPTADRINLLLAVAAMGLDGGDFAGRDFISQLMSAQNGSTGSFGLGPSDTAYAILALLAAGVPMEDPAFARATDYLEASQLADGTFEYTIGWGSDSNTQAVVIIALRKMGIWDTTMQKAIEAIKGFQNETNRGFYYQGMWGTDSDVSSSAMGIQAILAAGGNPTDVPYARGSESPANYLLSTQSKETGEFQDPWGSLRPTALAVPSLLGVLTPSVRIAESGIIVFGLAAMGVLSSRCRLRGP